jgi:glycerol transport system ATP-binding protein
MARIVLKELQHSYHAAPRGDDDWALKKLDLELSDGGAYALLGPSGSGKTTLLNIISGLVRPTGGRVFFGDVDVTNTPTDRRHIAQVFQFPVVYDTMTVYDNLAFPLRNRGLRPADVDARVREIARILDLERSLDKRARGLTADGKQKISLGRGLVRPDVNVIMFDEPLTVIDPHLKHDLRSKLKELHQKTSRTMIYVTHDQTEALTFAEAVVVLHEGMVVQVGSPVELFEKPHHTFVGHFIGSPGMNVLPCDLGEGGALLGGRPVTVQNLPRQAPAGKRLELGVRPEFVSFTDEGIPVSIARVSDAGRFRIVEARHGERRINVVVRDGNALPGERAHVRFDPAHTWLYADGWLVD